MGCLAGCGGMVDRRSENSKVLEESKRLTLTKNVGSTPTSSTRRIKMSSKRRIRRKQCTSKKRYPTQTDAVGEMIGIKKRTGEKLHSYKCKFCNGWHIGHLKGNNRVLRIYE